MRVEPLTRLVGHIAVPGDKSISHRAVLFGAICDGETRITGFGRSADTEATIEAVRALGITVYEHGEDTLHVFGKGLRGLVAPGRPIDCANSGTLVRLLSGILAGQQGQQFELTGDASLSSRPMKRITEPLGRMGAGVETDDGHLPLGIEGRPLRSITYELPVASAQVKSAILLAGLYAKGETTVVEPQPTRDHTELMLEAAGATITRREKSVTIQPAERLEPVDIEVPGDFSSAAPFIVAATLVPGSELHIHGVNLNPRRTGLLTILERMGGRVTVYNRRRVGGERVGRSRGALGRARRDDGSRRRGAARDRRAAALRARRLVRARQQPAAWRRGAAGEGVRPRRGDGRCPALARAARVRDRGRLPDPRRSDPAARRQDREPRRPPHRDARCDRGARLPGRRRDRGCRLRGGKLSRVLRVAEPTQTESTDMTSRSSTTSARGRVIVAIDGPAGAGKSSVARALAARLEFRYLDTGAMYRALTWLALHNRVELDDVPALVHLAREHPVEFGEGSGVFVGGHDVTAEIRSPEIDSAVPIVARHQEVREVMRERQRQLAEHGDSVIEGRDIGEVVAPHAELKIWLYADPEVRAARRHAERDGMEVEVLADEMRRRDERDAQNTHRAGDAIELDTTFLDLEQVIDRIEGLRRRSGSRERCQ